MKKAKCIWATNHRALDHSGDDITIAKIKYEDENGDIQSKVQIIENYERPVWITKPQYQDHTQYKDVERKDRCNEYRVNQARMNKLIQKVLTGKTYGYTPYSELAKSPYLYGSDQDGSAYFMNDFNKDTDPDFSFYTNVGVFDYETRVYKGMDPSMTGPPIVGAFSYKSLWVLVVDAHWFEHLDPVKAEETVRYYLKDEVEKRNPTIKIIPADNCSEVVDLLYREIKQTDIDILTGWNAGFDMEVSVNNASNPHDVLSANQIPPRFRNVEYIPGPKEKIKDNGQRQALDFSDIWNQLRAPATFLTVDSMCYYRTSRIHQGMLSSYSLDNILKKEKLAAKLKFTATDHLEGLEWHIAMQDQYPYEYLAYAMQDCVGLENLHDQTLDMKMSFLMSLGSAPSTKMKSNPSKLCYEYNNFLNNEDYVLGTVSKDMINELDRRVLGPNDWIRILSIERCVGDGTSIIEGVKDNESRVFFHSNDNDIAQGYPTIGRCINASYGTTMGEVISIDGLDETQQRRIGYELTALDTNAVEIAVSVLKLPTVDEALERL